MSEPLNLVDHFLIAMPGLQDGIFKGSVVYVCEHTEHGSMGIIINKPSPFSFDEICTELSITPKLEVRPSVNTGGPVSRQHGFILHSPQGQWDSTLTISEHVSLSSSKDILKAIAEGWGPENHVLSLGYAGWDADQLESELANNVWLSVAANPDVLFHTPSELMHQRALSQLGVSAAHLSADIGHA